MLNNPAPAKTSGIRFDMSNGSRLQTNQSPIGDIIPAKIAGNTAMGKSSNNQSVGMTMVTTIKIGSRTIGLAKYINTSLS